MLTKYIHIMERILIFPQLSLNFFQPLPPLPHSLPDPPCTYYEGNHALPHHAERRPHNRVSRRERRGSPRPDRSHPPLLHKDPLYGKSGHVDSRATHTCSGRSLRLEYQGGNSGGSSGASQKGNLFKTFLLFFVLNSFRVLYVGWSSCKVLSTAAPDLVSEGTWRRESSRSCPGGNRSDRATSSGRSRRPCLQRPSQQHQGVCTCTWIILCGFRKFEDEKNLNFDFSLF